MKRLVWGAACLLCGLGGPARGAPFWEDGGFSQYKPDSGSFTLYDTGERYQAWMVVGQNGNVALTSGGYVHNGLHFTAQSPARATTDAWMNLAGISQSQTGVMQHDVPTKIGSTYEITFYVGNMYDPGGIYGTSSTIAVYENSTLLGSFSNHNRGSAPYMSWKRFTVDFVAEARWTSVAFINMDPPGDMECGLDNVSFALVPGA